MFTAFPAFEQNYSNIRAEGDELEQLSKSTVQSMDLTFGDASIQDENIASDAGEDLIKLIENTDLVFNVFDATGFGKFWLFGSPTAVRRVEPI